MARRSRFTRNTGERLVLAFSSLMFHVLKKEWVVNQNKITEELLESSDVRQKFKERYGFMRTLQMRL